MIIRFLFALLALICSISVRAAPYDMVEMTVSGAPGTGTITLGSALPPYRSLSATSAVSGETIPYHIADGNNWENGRGVVTFGANITLSRGPLSSSIGGGAITASANAVVWVGALAEDMVTTQYPSQIVAPISAPTCTLTNAATIAINLAGCATSSTNGIDLGAITLTQNSAFAFPTGLPTGGNLKFGFRINPSTFTATFPSGYRFPSGSLQQGQPILAPSADNYVWCVSHEGSPPTIVDCPGLGVGMTAASSPAIWTLISHTGAPSTTGAGVTTAAISTTGANLIVVSFASDNAVPTLTDSQSNTWVLAYSSENLNAGYFARQYYVVSPTTSPSHTFTLTGASSFPTIDVQAWTKSGGTPALDTTNVDATNSLNVTSITAGSGATPTGTDLAVTGVEYDNGTTLSINGSFTISSNSDNGGNNHGGGGAYLAPVTTLQNPTWSWTGAERPAAGIALYK